MITPEFHHEASAAALTPHQRRELLWLAREAISRYLLTDTIPSYSTDDPALLRPAAVFVTLRMRADRYGPEQPEFPDIGPLRGCIGQLEADTPLCRAVQEAAVRAATVDPRFAPVRPNELADLVIDISVLSPFRIVESIDEIEIGRDGLYISGRGRRGLLLPDVAVMMDWDAQEFVRGTCQKANMPRDAWPEHAVLMAFSTEKMSELDDQG